jgi:hypothetical protein
MRSLGIVLLVTTLTSCAEVAFVKSIGNSVAINEMRERLALNVWSDSNLVAKRTVIDSDPEDTTIGVFGPKWSYGGMAIRIASLAKGERLYQPEFQVAAFTESGVHARLLVGTREIPLGGYFSNDWHRFPLSREDLATAEASGLTVNVDCEVGTWVFRMSAAYFQGFARKLTELGLTTLEVPLPPQP